MSKRYIRGLAVVLLAVTLLSGCAGKGEMTGNYTDEMKIEPGVDISEYGADSVERDGDHEGSLYFSNLDFYNMKSTDTMKILPKFKTIQQSDERTCALTCILMVFNYYGNDRDYDEYDLLKLHPEGEEMKSTSLPQAVAVFDRVGGFKLTTTTDFHEKGEELSLDTLYGFIDEDKPVMVCWNDWGGHWQIIIGYDTMGTKTEQDDVLIVADPYDTTDHNQDGYGVYPAQRFFYNFTTYNFFSEEEGNDQLFIVAEPNK
ncbi:hypothetical protein M2150_002912 [Lachnospiraceae bacterium PM6-15]|uniref:C39 family peptidase n=1 Tax=Ohessyouella blattaphilus TaxID=2949333 RepID=UPI003E1E5BA8